MQRTRRENAEDAAWLHDHEGLDGYEIAKRLGVSRSYAFELLNDPDGRKAKARKTRYAGTCVDCGAPTSGSEGRKKEPRCPACGWRKAGENKRVWTRESVLAAVHEWAAEHGEPPAVADWCTSTAYQINDPARAQRWLDANGRWPSASSARRTYGSWAAMLTAAGFKPREPNGGGGNILRRRNVHAAASAVTARR